MTKPFNNLRKKMSLTARKTAEAKTKEILRREVNYYINLPWTYTVETAFQKGKKYYIVRVNEIPGVCTDAPTLDQAMEDILKPLTGAIELYLEQGDPVPEPISKENSEKSITYRTKREFPS